MRLRGTVGLLATRQSHRPSAVPQGAGTHNYCIVIVLLLLSHRNTYFFSQQLPRLDSFMIQRMASADSSDGKFVREAAGPPGLFGVFEDDGETGYLYLYELRGRQLELLLRTPAVDFNANPDRFRNGVLEITYDSSRSSLLPDVVLAGAIEVLAEQEEKVLRSFPCQRRFSWDPSLRQYREELSQRVGFLEGSD